jgi:chromosome segregation ATPase
MADLKRLGDLSDAELWEKLGTNEVPWYNGAVELYTRLGHQRDRLADATRERDEARGERDRINRDAERHARRAERLAEEVAQASVQIDQVIAQRDALQAKLVWAEGELSKVWEALAGR